MPKRARQQGELEAQMMDVLWDAPAPQTSQQILESLSSGGELAITTVLTVLSRLSDKGLIKREAGEGRSLLFSATQTREAYAAESMLKLFAEAGNPALAMSHFAKGLTADQLAELKRAIK
jgi:predicted transcriptional regulator